MIEDIKTIAIIFSVLMQMLIAINIVHSNKLNISELRRQHEDLKELFKQLQDKVNDIRVKVGI